MRLSLFLILISLICSCSEIQRVCPTGSESPYMAIAAEYWSNQGYPVIISDDSECTIRSRVTESPLPEEPWGNEIGVHHVYDIGIADLEPSHLIQTEIRFRESKWVPLTHLERIYVTAHELGHTWHREHYDWMPMQAYVPDEKSISKWLADSGLSQYQKAEKP